MKKYIFLSAALLLLIASCSNDENNEQKEPTQAVQFSFTNEEFGEDETLTRSAETAKPQIVDLGDCEAEISVESEPAAKTRGAKKPANGHYTIRAYQAGTLKGEMKGTFSAGTFTPDASSPKDIVIPAGTYDFIAFNDDVTPSGTNLTTTRDKAETARMGFATQVITATPHKQTVNFTMKHMGCRLRTQFVCQKHIPSNITAMLEQTAANVIPASVAYNPATKVYTSTNGAMTAESSNSPASSQTKYDASNYGQSYAYTSTSNYHYFLPTTEGSKLKLTGISAGTVFWKPIPTFNVSKLNATLQMQPNKSYVVKIKFSPIFTYLMSDGTTDHINSTQYTKLRESDGFTKRYIDKNGNKLTTPKIPIALVLNADSHMAIALKDINGYKSDFSTSKYAHVQTNTHFVANSNDALQGSATSGLDETWNPSYTTSAVTDNKVKALNYNFPAFYDAAHYNPGVAYTGSPALKWYLPSYSDWKSLLSLGFRYNGSYFRTAYEWYGNLIESAFKQVGSVILIPSDQYWSSSALYDLYGAGCVGVQFWNMRWDAVQKWGPMRVRPFVKY